FSSQFLGGVSAKTGLWEMREPDSASSQVVERYLSAGAGAGILTTTHVFGGLSSGLRTFELYHKKSSGDGGVRTQNGSLVAIPLVTSTGTALNYGVDTLGGAGSSTTSNTLAPVFGLSTEVTLPASGNIFIAASFSAKTNAMGVGVWDVVVDGTAVGTSTQRFFLAGDQGDSVTLFALAEGLSEGDHIIALRAANTDGLTDVTTYNATLAAVALQLDENTYFPSFQASVDQATTTSGDFDSAVTTDVTLPSPFEYQVFVAGSYYSGALSTTGDYQVGFGGYNSQLVGQYMAGLTDYGVGGNVGLTTGTPLVADTYEAWLQFRGSSIDIYNPNLVGFALTAAPEPTTTVFALLAAGMGALVARRKRKNR
ncbi:MAG: hypothetical protein KAX19_02625, partial [Candidatus Brocadiae bacterium]|nr:hypothetical protein [Candidatus Brocadiia bacterium]